MSKKSFHLRWNNHLQNLQTLFENLFIEQSLIDVTISCSDGALYAHKLVLSACSPYFEQILKDNPCEHPVMILKGIKRQDMALLLEYMYKGAVDVAEEDLDNMLDTATELQIKGLIQDTPKSNQQRPASVKQERFDQEDAEHRVADDCPTGLPEDDMRWQAQLVAQPSRSHANLKSEEIMQPEDSIRNSMDTQTHHTSPEPQEMNDSQNEASSSTNFPLKHVLREDEEDSTGNEEDNNDYSQMEDSSQNISLENIFPANGIMSDAIEFNWVCHICQRKFQNKNSYQRHMLTHAGVKPNHCTVCGKSFLRLSHLQRHIRVHTGERPYSCSQCHKQFARSDKLRQHFIIQHNTPAGTIPRGRGRPRKNIAAYGASGDLQILQSADNPYPVTINPVSMAPSLPYHPSISMSAT